MTVTITTGDEKAPHNLLETLWKRKKTPALETGKHGKYTFRFIQKTQCSTNVISIDIDIIDLCYLLSLLSLLPLLILILLISVDTLTQSGSICNMLLLQLPDSVEKLNIGLG